MIRVRWMGRVRKHERTKVCKRGRAQKDLQSLTRLQVKTRKKKR